MEQSKFINLQQDGHKISVKVNHSGTFVSPHSGRELREIKGIVQNLSEEFHNWFMEMIKQQTSEGILSLETIGEPACRWNISLPHWSLSGPNYSYTLELREIESLEIQELILDQVPVHPYRYNEEAHKENGIRIDAKVALSKDISEQFIKIWNKGGYFPVIRRGIQEEPREMRFGAVYWSEHNDTLKYDFVLVERTPADEAPSHPWDLSGTNARSHLAFEIALRKNLLDLLLKKGIISEEEITGLKEKAELESERIGNLFHLVKDVDLLP